MVTMTSDSAPVVRAACSASTVSPVMGRRCGSAPSARVPASSAQALLLRTWPARMLALISTISSPVGTMAALARGWARTVVTPTDPSTPISAGPRRRPASTTICPRADVAAGRANVLTRIGAFQHRDLTSVGVAGPRVGAEVAPIGSVRVLERHDGVGAGGDGGACHDPCCFTGLQRHRAHSAGGNFVHYPQLRRRGRGRLG